MCVCIYIYIYTHIIQIHLLIKRVVASSSRVRRWELGRGAWGALRRFVESNIIFLYNNRFVASSFYSSVCRIKFHTLGEGASNFLLLYNHRSVCMMFLRCFRFFMTIVSLNHTQFLDECLIMRPHFRKPPLGSSRVECIYIYIYIYIYTHVDMYSHAIGMALPSGALLLHAWTCLSCRFQVSIFHLAGFGIIASNPNHACSKVALTFQSVQHTYTRWDKTALGQFSYANFQDSFLL